MNTSKNNDAHLDVADHKIVWNWLSSLSNDPDSFILLTGENRRRLKIILGDPNIKPKTENTDWTFGWGTSMFGLNFIILCGPELTKYYIKTPTSGDDYLADAKVGIGVIQFLEHTLKKLRETP